MRKLLYRLMMVIWPALCGAALFTGCEDVQYNRIDDLFQPRFVLERPEVVSNSITMVWYEVNNAESYTVELHRDTYYTTLFMSVETEDPYVLLDDIPYGTTFYIRVRCNAANEVNNSQWAYTSASTEARPEFAKVLNDISKTEITESSAVIRWDLDAENPVDSISVMPTMGADGDILTYVSRYLTIEEMMNGWAEIDGLEKNMLYAVNVYDTSKPRKYDKPYNQVTLRTAGPAAGSIQVPWGADLTEILQANNDDSEIPEGTEYFLPAGSAYRVTPFAIKKGFRLVGSTEGEKPIVTLEGTWNVVNGSYIASLEFVNVAFTQITNNQYFFNTGSSYTIENVSFVNCDFISIRRGFWRHQGANAKHIMYMEFEGCRFDQCGWQTGCYGTFHFQSYDGANSVSYDQIDRAVFRSCTFSRDNDGTAGYGWGNIFYAPYMDKPIQLEMKNITVYNYCRDNRIFNLESAVGSEFVVEGFLLASPCGDFCTLGANTVTSFADNYTTTDYLLGGSKMQATDLPISAADLFVDPANGDYTIKDLSSPVVTNRAGDTRWLP